MFLLDRIRSSTSGNLQMIEMDAVVRPIEAFGVAVRWNWRPEVLRQRDVRRRVFLGIFKEMMARIDLRKGDGWICNSPSVVSGCRAAPGRLPCGVEERSTRAGKRS